MYTLCSDLKFQSDRLDLSPKWITKGKISCFIFFWLLCWYLVNSHPLFFSAALSLQSDAHYCLHLFGCVTVVDIPKDKSPSPPEHADCFGPQLPLFLPVFPIKVWYLLKIPAGFPAPTSILHLAAKAYLILEFRAPVICVLWPRKY